MTIEALAAREQALLLRLSEHPGSTFDAEEQHAIEQESAAIYAGYLAIILRQHRPLEALKRALFMQWNAFLEPFHITGTGRLDPVDQRRVMEAFEQALAEAWIDEEARYMLHWYNSITPWYFDEYRTLPKLAPLLSEVHGAIGLAKHISTQDLTSRGMMGAYFDEMVGYERDHPREDLE